MFFPSCSETIELRFSNPGRKRYPLIDDVNWSGVNREYLSYKDQIRKAYPIDNSKPLYGYEKPKEPTTIKIVKGEKLKCGVRRFLSYNGKSSHLVQFNKGVEDDDTVDFDCISGRYLLICCFTVPMPTFPSQCRSLIAAYDEFYQLGFPLDLVVVANMRTDVVYDLEAAFRHFYSAFSCLAIPFSDFETRDFIYSSMHSSTIAPEFDTGPMDHAILVDPQGIILHRDMALYYLVTYGSDWAPPFLPTTLDAIDKHDDLLRSTLDPMYLPLYPFDEDSLQPSKKKLKDSLQPLSLHRDILFCEPFLPLLHSFDSATETRVTVQDLSHKYVGLYLFKDGEIMQDIKAAHDHCLANNQQLEIVLVPTSLDDEPLSYRQQLHHALRHLKIKSWFLCHLPTYACRRLWRIFGRECLHLGEKFIIIPPDCKSGELCGREIINHFGVDQYPFTRTSILKQKLEYVRSLTPIFSSSLFNNCPMIQNGQEFKSEQLQGKNVLLYISWDESDHFGVAKKHYPEIKAMGWEIVLVLLDDMECTISEKCLNLQEMPWPCMLVSAAAGASIKTLFFPHADKETVYLFAVRKDGNIVSRDVEDRLHTLGVTESLFDDVLEADLALVLATMPLCVYNRCC